MIKLITINGITGFDLFHIDTGKEYVFSQLYFDKQEERKLYSYPLFTNYNLLDVNRWTEDYKDEGKIFFLQIEISKYTIKINKD